MNSRQRAVALGIAIALIALAGLLLYATDQEEQADENAQEASANAEEADDAQGVVAAVVAACDKPTQRKQLRELGVCEKAIEQAQEATEDDVEPILIPGPEGEQGIRGERGFTGPQGEQGEQGPPGERGRRGPAGEDGADGAAGPVGASCVEALSLAECRGPIGATGPQGERGPQGPQGPRGEQGPQGAAGERGPQGTARPGTYTCPQGEALVGFTVAEGGAVTLDCRPAVFVGPNDNDGAE